MSGARRAGVDVGGTFTDIVVVGPDGLQVHKRPSTPDDPARAVLEGLAAVDPTASLPVAHGTTVATNALLERTGARTALVTNRGLADVLRLGRGRRDALYALSPRDRPALVPSERCFEVDARRAPDGSAVRPLTDAEVSRVARAVADAKVEAVAVCLLYAYLQPEDERRLGAAIVAAAPDVHCSLSVDVRPEVREYERASTTTVNAYLAPVMARYLDRLAKGVAPRRLTVMGSHAGTLPPAEAAQRAVGTVLSGPAAGVTGALAVARASGVRRVLTLDMGGTSTDVALCDGAVPFASATTVGGLPVHRATVDVRTVGAGGGSLVWCDDGGALRVGPRSAGAVPGPAAYGRGGTTPTLTDASVVLGRLPAALPLAGGLRLDGEAARTALGTLGERLGLGPAGVARGAVAVANARMARALRRVSVERGYDPADFVLVAFGGAGPLHACELAAALRVGRVLVPSVPGALSALGLATAASSAVVSRSVLRSPGGADVDAASVFRQLEADARAVLPDAADLELARAADLRYAGQSWSLTIDWPPDGDARGPFEAAHRRRYGYARPAAPVELVTLRVRATAADALAVPAGPPPTARVARKQTLVLPDGSRVEVVVRPRASLGPDETVVGPALLTQADTTTYVAPGWQALADASGAVWLERAGA